VTIETIPATECWWCGDDLKDPPLSDHWGLCDGCDTKPLARMATKAMNRCHRARLELARADYELQKTQDELKQWRKWDIGNQGDWSNDVEEAMP